MMHAEGIAGLPAPTPYSRIRSPGQKAGFLARELWLYHVYLVTGK